MTAAPQAPPTSGSPQSVFVTPTTSLVFDLIVVHPRLQPGHRRGAERAHGPLQADGVGITLAARLLGRPLRGRTTGVALTEALAALAAREGYRIFLLGATPGVAAEAGRVWAARYPGLQIAGAYPGSPAEDEREEIAVRISAGAADLLFVAFGAPAQDLWIARNRAALPTVRLAMGVGGVFDYVTGRAPLAPPLVRRVGLEWLYRLYRQPWRWRRQLALPVFVVAVLGQRLGVIEADPMKGPHERHTAGAGGAVRRVGARGRPARRARDDAELVNQALLGTPAEVLESRARGAGGVRLPDYTGWMRAPTATAPAETGGRVRVAAQRADLRILGADGAPTGETTPAYAGADLPLATDAAAAGMEGVVVVTLPDGREAIAEPGRPRRPPSPTIAARPPPCWTRRAPSSTRRTCGAA